MDKETIEALLRLGSMIEKLTKTTKILPDDMVEIKVSQASLSERLSYLEGKWRDQH